MPRRTLFTLALSLLAPLIFAQNPDPAPRPPMGWSEWDAYGLTVTEADFRANAAVLAQLKQYGWTYALLDAGWYEESPASPGPAQRGYLLDGNGRLIPAPGRFPSAGGANGFRPLAQWLHARGLKLGIHVMPGIPRQAVSANAPIAGSSFHAADAADTTQTCSWDREFYVAKDNAAGQAYYDSIAALYASWGIDFIKLGCVSDHPFHASAVRQIREAIRKTGRPMVLSLSPGPPPHQQIDLVSNDSEMWRFSAEHWDFWTPPPATTNVGLREDFDLFAQWMPCAKPGHWIDGDALPDGWLAPHPAWGPPRHSRLTPDEQRSEFALWVFARAPLIEGANLTRLDALTRSLMTNRELLKINQDTVESHPVNNLPSGFENARVWEAQTAASGQPQHSFGFFNLSDKPAVLHASWTQLGLPGGAYAARNLWTGRRLPASPHIDIRLPAHGCVVYQLSK